MLLVPCPLGVQPSTQVSALLGASQVLVFGIVFIIQVRIAHYLLEPIEDRIPSTLDSMRFRGGFSILMPFSGGITTSAPSTPSASMGFSSSLIGRGVPDLLRRWNLLALCVSKRDPQRDGEGHIGCVLAQSCYQRVNQLGQHVDVLLKTLCPCFTAGLTPRRPSSYHM